MPGDSTIRAVVTGYGVHTAIEPFDGAFALQQRREHRITWQELASDEGALRCVGAACSHDPPLPYLAQRKWLKYMSLETQFSVWAAGKALSHAGLWGTAVGSAGVRESMALFLATGPIAFDLKDVLPGLLASRGQNSELDFAAMGVAGLRNCPPMMPFHTLRNMPVGLVSMIFGIKGQNAIYYPDAEQSLFAFSAAQRAIQHGRVSAALVGGAAHLLSMMPMVRYGRRGDLAQDVATAVPFGSGHRGWALGDAAAMVVLESEQHAIERNARIYGVLDVEPTAVSVAELTKRNTLNPREPDLTLITGTQTADQDAEATRIAAGRPCLSLDSITGYTDSASPTLNLVASCRLLECPSLIGGGGWKRTGCIDVLSVSTSVNRHRWGRLRLEAVE